MLVNLIIAAGRTYRFPELVQKTLHRQPTPADVAALVCAYHENVKRPGRETDPDVDDLIREYGDPSMIKEAHGTKVQPHLTDGSAAAATYHLYRSGASNVAATTVVLIAASSDPATAAEETIQMFYDHLQDTTWPTRHERIMFCVRLARDYTIENHALLECLVADLVSIGHVHEFAETVEKLLGRRPYAKEIFHLAKGLKTWSYQNDDRLVEYANAYGDLGTQQSVRDILDRLIDAQERKRKASDQDTSLDQPKV